MATGKAQKKDKLRHAEYYDFQEIQDMLYADSNKGKVFKHLVEIIALPENIRLAYRNIKKNHGSMTPGTDGKTITELATLSDEQLISSVQHKLDWYVPQSVRRVEIPKGNDPTKKRPLGIPTIMDRLIQQCVLQVMEPICEAKFHDHSYGFRPNRNQQHAIAQVHKDMQRSNLHYVVDIDIRGFFDNVNHGKLLKQLWTMGIHDKKLLSILSAMLKAEVAGIGFPEVGTPQGGIISPLLSNVVLNELDWWLASQWEEIPTEFPYKETVNPNGSVSKSHKFSALRRTKLKEVTCVRYADDFKIFTNSYQNKANYELVYSAPLAPETSLEDIYTRFNIDHPKDFKGHSLSVSDVVVLHQNGQDTAHYVDSVGFRQVPEFLQEQKQLTPDELTTGETIQTPRGTFHVTAMSREQIEAAGYGFHHQSDDGKYLIMGNGTRAFAVAAEQPEKANPLKHIEDTVEQNDNNFDGIINNTPTVDELEAKVKAGETISLVDLANAVKADKERGKEAKPEKKPSIRAQLRADKEKAQKKNAKQKLQDLERS